MKQELYRVAERHVRKGTALKVFVVNIASITTHAVMAGRVPAIHVYLATRL